MVHKYLHVTLPLKDQIFLVKKACKKLAFSLKSPFHHCCQNMSVLNQEIAKLNKTFNDRNMILTINLF